MPAPKKNLYVAAELNFLEDQIKEAMLFLRSRPLSALVDRIEMKPTRGGGMMPMVVATVEDQAKANVLIMEKLLAMLPALNQMRETASDDIGTKGGVQRSERMLTQANQQIGQISL